MFAEGLFTDGFWAADLWSDEASSGTCLDPAEAMQYLASLGISAPPFMVSLYIETICSIQPCLEEHYPPHVQKLIKFNLLGILAFSASDKYVSSESAPNGASRSYRYRNDGQDRYAGLVSSLKLLDPYGCTTALIPPDPTNSKPSFAGLWIGKGGCGC